MTDDSMPGELRFSAGLGPAPALVERLRTRPTGDPYLHMMVHEAADEIERLRAVLELAAPALELGCDSLRSEAERYHAEMAGYRPHRHKEADDAYKRAGIAWQAVVTALGPNVRANLPP